MSKNSAQPPAPPDPAAVSAAQTGSNVNTAVANTRLGNANTHDPWSSTSFRQIGSSNIGGNDVPQWERTTTLAPAQQQMLDLQNQTGIGLNQLALNQTHSISDLLSRPVNAEGLPGMQGPAQTPNFSGLQNGPNYQVAHLQGQGAPFGHITESVGPQDFSADRQAVTDAYLSRMNPQLDRDRASLENQLVNQGFARGSEGFGREMDQFGRQANDARTQAILAGGQEQSRLAGLQLNQANFANQAQQQGFGQQQGQLGFNNAVVQGNAANANDAANQAYQNSIAQTQYGNQNNQQDFQNQTANAQLQNQVRQGGLQERYGLQSFPINEITALMSGGQVQQPNAAAFQGGQIAPTNVSGNTYNSAALAQQNYQNQLAQQNAAMGGMFGLGSAALTGGMYGGQGGFNNSLFGKLWSSDRRLKRDIIDTGIKLMNGLKLYSYRYVWDAIERVGLIADEVVKVKPQAVHNVGGYAAVDYDLAMEAV